MGMPMASTGRRHYPFQELGRASPYMCVHTRNALRKTGNPPHSLGESCLAALRAGHWQAAPQPLDY